jgi:hypothetical protein
VANFFSYVFRTHCHGRVDRNFPPQKKNPQRFQLEPDRRVPIASVLAQRLINSRAGMISLSSLLRSLTSILDFSATPTTVYPDRHLSLPFSFSSWLVEHGIWTPKGRIGQDSCENLGSTTAP